VYIDSFVIGVPSANREAFIDHARTVDAMLIEYGALRIVEVWGEDVPPRTTTDFYRAVQATPFDGKRMIFGGFESVVDLS